MDSVADSVILDLDHVGRFGVKREELRLSAVPRPVIKKKEVTFTAQSPRLDAVTGAMFGISRTAAAKHISEGLVSLNYSVCTSADAQIKPGDTISVRGKGKGVLAEEGGVSRKGRTFYTAEIYL
jgi:RNA-binding protein YlmH